MPCVPAGPARDADSAAPVPTDPKVPSSATSPGFPEAGGTSIATVGRACWILTKDGSNAPELDHGPRYANPVYESDRFRMSGNPLPFPVHHQRGVAQRSSRRTRRRPRRGGRGGAGRLRETPVAYRAARPGRAVRARDGPPGHRGRAASSAFRGSCSRFTAIRKQGSLCSRKNASKSAGNLIRWGLGAGVGFGFRFRTGQFESPAEGVSHRLPRAAPGPAAVMRGAGGKPQPCRPAGLHVLRRLRSTQ